MKYTEALKIAKAQHCFVQETVLRSSRYQVPIGLIHQKLRAAISHFIAETFTSVRSLDSSIQYSIDVYVLTDEQLHALVDARAKDLINSHPMTRGLFD